MNDRVKMYCSSVDLVDELEKEVTQLKERVSYEISLRPRWAQGYSIDSIAAQGATSALHAIWDALGASNQTEAMRICESFRLLTAKTAPRTPAPAHPDPQDVL